MHTSTYPSPPLHTHTHAGMVTLIRDYTVCSAGDVLTPEQCRILVCDPSLVPRTSFPGLPSFWLLAVCKNGKGRSDTIYHVSDVNVYQGRQRGKRPLMKRKISRPFVRCSVDSSAVVPNVHQTKSCRSLLIRTKNVCVEHMLFQLKASCMYVGRYWHHSHDK